jgi:hypothetical protein
LTDKNIGEARDEWLRALRTLNGSAAFASQWRQERYAFAQRVGAALVDGESGPSLTGSVVYGVWLKWGLIYVGQTTEAQRRLRDLVVGESHHLANTFPPEIWQRVVVVQWPKLDEAAAALTELGSNVVGLALEHRMQAWLHPLVNASRRRPDGGWRDVDWDRSRSVGARAGAQIDALFEAVRSLWLECEAAGPSDAPHPDSCRIVHPAEMLASRSI